MFATAMFFSGSISQLNCAQPFRITLVLLLLLVAARLAPANRPAAVAALPTLTRAVATLGFIVAVSFKVLGLFCALF